ncbi:MAG: hypothetical protein QHG98_06880 [Methanothrix sp.]|jgi:DNA-binding MarR family transcriptional regulator|uniref:hypothetical protein n=1 Tax=Methanothrix sp. TaxID=90426 RepID=UPI00247E2B00|nr:hypothetical protein [Methanothrix sp.]
MDEMERLLLKEKPCQALLAILELDHAYASLISKKIDSTFAHTLRILSQLEQAGLVSTRTEGRVRYAELTSPGRRAAEALRMLREAVEDAADVKKRIKRIHELIDAAERAQGDRELLAGPLRRDLALLRSRSGTAEIDLLESRIRRILSRQAR